MKRQEIVTLLRTGSVGYEREAFAPRREPSWWAARQARIEGTVRWFHGESDVVSRSPKLLADLREDGEVMSWTIVA